MKAHTEVDLADLLHLIQQARDAGRDEGLCRSLEDFVGETWSVLKLARAVIEEGLAGNNWLGESINSLVVVASFISGVQGQMIGLTYRSNNTHIQITINFFLFVGMTLDVIGAATGVISLILVRQYVERSRSLLVHITEMHARTYELTKRFANEAKYHNDTVRDKMNKLEFLCAQVKDVLKAHAWVKISEIPIAVKFQTLLETLDISSNGGPPTPYFALIPVLAISLGTLCLLASVLAFAFSTQLRAVWLTGVIITTFALLLMLTLWISRKAAKHKTANYKTLEWRLRTELRVPL